MKKTIKLLFLVLLFSLNNQAQHTTNSNTGKTPVPDSILTNFLGSWKGTGIHEGKQRIVEVEISRNALGKAEYFWTIRQTGIFRKPFAFSSWNAERKSLMMENGFFELKYDKENSLQIQATISRHESVINCTLKKVSTEILPYKLESISFNNGDVKLAGTLSIPKLTNKMPAVIFLHGSGDEDRWSWAPYFADMLSRMGIVCLFFDKRGCGESTGSWISSSLDDLSADANKAMEYLKTQDYVDKSNVGFWGFSQSGWVAPNCLTTNKEIAFMMINSGGANSPREIELFNYRNTMLHNGMNQSQLDSAFSLLDFYFEYLDAKHSLDEMKGKIAIVKNSSWYKYINIGRVLPSEKNRMNWNWVANYDPLSSIRTINFPLLLMFGGKDLETNTPVAVQKWKSSLSKEALNKTTIKVFENGNHGIRIGEHSPGALLFWQEFAPGYVDFVRKWANRNILRKN